MAKGGTSISRTVFVTVMTLLMLGPLFWFVTSSLKNAEQFFSNPPVWIPIPPYVQNYSSMIRQTRILGNVVQSLKYALALSVTVVVSSSLAAYGFSRFRFPGRRFWFGILLATMMVPIQVTTIPLFILFSRLDLVNTIWPLVLPNAFGVAYHVFLIRQFMNTIPAEIDEAATIDGAGHFRRYLSIILPLTKPVLLVSGLFNFFFAWRDVWFSSIYLQRSDIQTIAVRLLSFIGDQRIQYGELMAAAVVATVPVFVLYFSFQRFLDRGITLVDLR